MSHYETPDGRLLFTRDGVGSIEIVNDESRATVLIEFTRACRHDSKTRQAGQQLFVTKQDATALIAEGAAKRIR